MPWVPFVVWAEFIKEHRDLRERCDRLTEAVAHQQGLPVRMPQAEVNRPPLEAPRTWFDTIHPTVKALAKSLSTGDKRQ